MAVSLLLSHTSPSSVGTAALSLSTLQTAKLKAFQKLLLKRSGYCHRFATGVEEAENRAFFAHRAASFAEDLSCGRVLDLAFFLALLLLGILQIAAPALGII